MIWGIMALVVIIWVGRKMRPAHLGDDILKWEIFRHLRYKNAQDASAHMSYEDLEKRQWLQFTGLTLIVFVCTSLFLGIVLDFSVTSCIMTSSVIGAIWAESLRRFTRTYRRITLPLFATLCRIPQSRWDMRARPWNWVRYSPKKGKVWIRLPKDWHATKLHLKNIQELVNARVPGQWHMNANTSGFLLSFTRESEPESILIPEPEKEDESLKWEMEDKEVSDNGPW